MKFLNLRKKFITKFIIDGKKYNSFYILNNIFQFLNIKNKHNYSIFNIFFLIIEPLFYIEKIVSMSQLIQYVLFLPRKKKIRTILNLLGETSKKITPTKFQTLSQILSGEIYNSLFKTSFIYATYKLQNENFLKLKNNSHYRWF